MAFWKCFVTDAIGNRFQRIRFDAGIWAHFIFPAQRKKGRSGDGTQTGHKEQRVF